MAVMKCSQGGQSIAEGAFLMNITQFEAEGLWLLTSFEIRDLLYSPSQRKGNVKNNERF
jgi:hypothetical protein